MCLIITLIMLFLSVQNLLESHWLIGSVQLLIAFIFSALLVRNIRITHCEKTGNCDTLCSVPQWLSKYFSTKNR